MRAGAHRLVPFVAAALGAVACAHADPTPAANGAMNGASFTLAGGGPEEGRSGTGEPVSLTSAALDTPDHPANRIAVATCERRAECERDHGAEGETPMPQAACLATMRFRADDALDGASCENGLDDARLSECIESLRKTDCAERAAADEDITRVSACAPSRICAR